MTLVQLPPESIKLRIARLLESYGAITSLNFISGISRLLINEFEDPDGRDRLVLAMIDISEWAEAERQYLFKQTYEFVSDNSNVEYKALFLNNFIDVWLRQSKADSEWIYNQTKNNLCGQYLIVNAINDIMKLGEVINDRL